MIGSTYVIFVIHLFSKKLTYIKIRW